MAMIGASRRSQIQSKSVSLLSLTLKLANTSIAANVRKAKIHPTLGRFLVTMDIFS